MTKKDLLLQYEKDRKELTRLYRNKFLQLEDDFRKALEALQEMFLLGLEKLPTESEKPVEKPSEPVVENPTKVSEPTQKIITKRGSNNAWNMTKV